MRYDLTEGMTSLFYQVGNQNYYLFIIIIILITFLPTYFGFVVFSLLLNFALSHTEDIFCSLFSDAMSLYSAGNCMVRQCSEPC